MHLRLFRLGSNFQIWRIKLGKVGNFKTDDSIPKNQSDPLTKAMYFEFGTGLSASQILAPYPQWVKDIAYEYYVSGGRER